jgi:hypothetical protein
LDIFVASFKPDHVFGVRRLLTGNSLDWIGFLQDRILILHRLRTERFFGRGYLLVYVCFQLLALGVKLFIGILDFGFHVLKKIFQLFVNAGIQNVTGVRSFVFVCLFKEPLYKLVTVETGYVTVSFYFFNSMIFKSIDEILEITG